MDPRLTAAMKAYERRTPASEALWRRATEYTPLGVHSNYRYLEPYPFYVRRAEGVHLWDVDGNEYLDFNMGFGGLASGHAHPKLVEAMGRQLRDGALYGYEWGETPAVAERLCRRFSMAQIRFSSTGLEATHHAVRIARGRTRRRYILKFEGGYHGSHDSLLVGVKPRPENAGPADRPASAPAGPGVLPELTERTRVAPFNDLDSTERIAKEIGDDLAAIILEPVPMNMGLVLPRPGFLEGLRELCDRLGAMLIFDEVKTASKYPRGAFGRFGVRPDLMLMGKSIACGAPLSAIAGGPGMLDGIGPRKIPHAGTFNANPLSIACCRATLDHVLTEENMARAATLCEKLADGYGQIFRDHHIVGHVSADGPSGTVYFSDHPVHDWRSFLTVDGERSILYYYLCLNRGLIPSGTGADEQWTVSVVHTPREVESHLSTLSEIAGELTGAPVTGEIEESV
ncbi:MAG TPA: aminotransferase class III-fold pyridoxal phosphate-dependent enzyme [Thermoplasmata archaeon]|nr:aminotransferase class III-fold pyridoxal phosphate-dependent enzyme [Thermoplasmata archaeon]